MSLSFYSYSIKKDSQSKQWITKALKKFDKTDLSKLSTEQVQQSVELYKKIFSSKQQVFIFAFGGIGACFKTAQSFFALKNKKALLIDALDSFFIEKISRLSQKELCFSHFVFISKSGQTSEILFYKRLLKRLYSKNKMSLKNKLTIFTQKQDSPLILWGKKEQAFCVFLEDSLPGRFSFFSLSGCFQLQACGLKIKPSALSSFFIDPRFFDFFKACLSKKEIYFCFFKEELNEISRWLERSWSESLFKESMKKKAPALRLISWPDLRHAFIEELIAKKEQVCFFGLDFKANKADPSKESLKELLKLKKTASLFIEIDKNLSSFFELIFLFYKSLFLAGEFSKVDIKKQHWVDYFKK